MPHRREDSPPFTLFAFQDIVTSVTGIMILVTLLIAVELLRRQESSPRHQTAVLNQDLERQIRETEGSVQDLQRDLRERHLEAGGDALLDAATLAAQLRELREQQEVAVQERRSLASRLDRTSDNLREFEQKERERRDEVTTLERLRAELEAKQQQLEKLTSTNRLVYNPDQRTTKTQWLVEIDGQRLSVARMGVAARPQHFGRLADFKNWADARLPAADRFMLVVKPGPLDSYAWAVDYLEDRGFQFGYDLIATDQVIIDPQTGAGL